MRLATMLLTFGLATLPAFAGADNVNEHRNGTPFLHATDSMQDDKQPYIACNYPPKLTDLKARQPELWREDPVLVSKARLSD